MKIKGLDQVTRKLKDLQRRAQNLDGTHSVPVSELLAPSFMQRYTNFATFDAMLAASGFKAETKDEFEAIPDDKWDAFIVSATRFSDWQSMLTKAGEEWAKKQLGL